MKLTKLSVDSYGIYTHLCLSNLNSGLNVFRGNRDSGKSTLARYIRNLLFGFETGHSIGLGSIEAAIDGATCRLSRAPDSRQQLVVADIRGSNSSGFQSERLKGMLDGIGFEIFDAAFLLDAGPNSQSLSDLSRVLQQRHRVPAGRIGLGNDAEHDAAACRVQQLESRVDSASAEIARLENERSILIRKVEDQQSSRQTSQFEIDSQMRTLTREIEALNLVSIRSHIASLDRETSDLRIRLETALEGVEFVSRPQRPADGLNVLYRRLDEVDNQMRRWRSFLDDVQQQRVRLKDEMVVWNQMTIDASGHPFHRAQEILSAIGSKVGLAENSIGEFRINTKGDIHSADQITKRMSDLHGQIHADLNLLCDELGAQFKHLRHRPAAAELKRLRKCSEEITRNLDALVHQRQNTIAEIRTIDVAGAEAIVRNEPAFCQYAQQQGFLQARRKFIGEISAFAHASDSGSADVSQQRLRLKELEKLRAERVRELVAAENQFGSLEAQRQSLLTELQKLPIRLDANEYRERRGQIELNLKSLAEQRQSWLLQIEQQRRIVHEPAHPILALANQIVQRLSRGEIRKIWLESHSAGDQRYSVASENLHGLQSGLTGLNASLQQLVRLSLSFAVVEHLRRFGQQLPMILDEVFHSPAAESMGECQAFLAEFSAWGNQVIVLTADPAIVDLCRRAGATVFDLPETSVSPVVPNWTPDILPMEPLREPEFLTPFTTRLYAAVPATVPTYPMVKYPPTGRLIDYSIENFESEPVIVTPNFIGEPVIDESSDLQELAVIDPNSVIRLNRLRVEKIGQLLAINPRELSSEFLAARFSVEQIDGWQSCAWLMMCVPELRAIDAQILVAIGIAEPEQLENSNAQQVVEKIQRYLASAAGQRYFDRRRDYNRELINRWFDSLDQTGNQWRIDDGFSRRSRWTSAATVDNVGSWHRFDRSRMRDWRPTPDPVVRSSNRSSGDRTARTVFASTANQTELRPSATIENPNLKFHLELNDKLEAAPSIGPKTAERFHKFGVYTVADFLTQTAESMAVKIKYKRISADVIRQWQHQARLVCKVPNLRGSDAQLLVACGVIEPEELANFQPARLLAIIEPFSESKEGLKIVRSGKQPNLEEITHWIQWARATRPFKVA